MCDVCCHEVESYDPVPLSVGVQQGILDSHQLQVPAKGDFTRRSLSDSKHLSAEF